MPSRTSKIITWSHIPQDFRKLLVLAYRTRFRRSDFLKIDLDVLGQRLLQLARLSSNQSFFSHQAFYQAGSIVNAPQASKTGYHYQLPD